jgi:RNA polymerase sigma factor (sigma-70 family)
MSAEPLNLLLERIRQGDSIATAELVAHYEQYLHAVIHHSFPDRLRHCFDSIDVVQSVWVHVLPGLRSGAWQFPDRAHLQAFLVKVARRRLISRLRHHAVAAQRENAESVDVEALPAPKQPRPSEEVQANDLWSKMLALCPPQHHRLLQLRRQGLGLEEVARRTALHEGSVRRILRQLARRLALEHSGEPEV